MSVPLFRRTAAAMALLLGAIGLPGPLSAAATTQRPAPPTTVDASGRSHHLRGVAALRALHPPVSSSKAANLKVASPKAGHAQTPFERVMLPKILAKQAADRAQGKQPKNAEALKLHAKGTPYAAAGGLTTNFPGLQQPSYFNNTSYFTNDDTDTSLALTADVNNDGKPDLVTLQYDGSLSVNLNTGSGLSTTITGANYSTSTFEPNLHVDWASAVDLNKDGYPDIEFTDAYNSNVYIFMNKGDGTFGTVQQISLGSSLPSGNKIGFDGGGSAGGDVIFADVTNDGFPDMIVVSGQYPAPYTTQLSVQVFVGVDDGTFPSTSLAAQTYTLDNTYLVGSYHSLQVADMNGDGKVDLVYPVSGTSYVNDVSGVSFGYNYVLTGGSNGVFSSIPAVSDTSAAAYAVGSNEFFYSSYVHKAGSSADQPSVFTAGYYGAYSQLSNGDGTLQAAVATLSDTLNDADDAQFADVNNDGSVDILTASEGYFTIYLGNGDGTFSPTVSAQFVGGYDDYQTEPQPADFNGDGKTDIVNVGEWGDAGLFLGTGGAGYKMFAGAPIIAGPDANAYDVEAILAGNLAGHGFNDILEYNYTNEDCGSVRPASRAGQNSIKPNCSSSAELDTAINDGHGNFTYVTALSSTDFGSIPWTFVFPFTIDVNNDGKQDILIAAADATGLYYAPGNGDGTFTTPVAMSLGGSLACPVNNAVAADLNGDGKTDMVIARGSCGSGDFTNSGYFTLINNGDGTFTPSSTDFGSNLYSVAIADVNNDGTPDLVALGAGEDEGVFVLPGLTGNLFDTGNKRLIYGSNDIYSIALGDYDGDGKTDVALFGYINNYGVTLLKNIGNLAFNIGPGYLFETYVYGGAYVDFNTDGRPDLALTIDPDEYSPYEGFAYAINLGGGNFSDPTLLYSAYNDLEAENEYGFSPIIADFNGDGAPDALATSYDSSGIFYNEGAISMTLATSASTATQDSSVTLTATLAPTVGSTPATGTVTFYDNGVAIGTATVTNGVATLTLDSLPVGNNVITAVYSGDGNYNAATSTASVNGSGGSTSVGVTALPAAFTMTASNTTLDLTVGQTGTATFTVTGNATFNGAISFTCSGAPKGTSCTILPGTVNLAGVQTATVAVVLDTTAPNNHFNASNFMPGWMKTTGGITLAGGLLLLLPSRRRRQIWPLVLFATLGLGAAVSLTGCSHKYEGTPAGTYTVNVAATSGSITQSGTITMTIHK